MSWSGRLRAGGTLARAVQPTGAGEFVRRRVVSTYANAHCPAGGRIVDLGAGPGHLRGALRPDLRARYTVVDVDPGPHGLRMIGDVTSVPVASGSADLVCLSDVLEHVVHDREAVQEAVRTARPGGMIVAHVPSVRVKPYAFLRRAADEAEAADHQQFPHVRDGYTRQTLEDMLSQVREVDVVSIAPSFTAVQSLVSDVDAYLWWRRWTVLRAGSWLAIRLASLAGGRAKDDDTSSGYLAVLRRRGPSPRP